jgi:leucyl aminopeptidase
MKITTTSESIAEQQVDALLLGVSADNQLDDAGNQLDQALGGKLRDALSSVGFTGARGSTCSLPTFGQIPARTIIVTGMGDLASVTVDSIRAAWGEAGRAARKAGATSIASAPPASAFGSAAIRAAVEGIELGLYQHLDYRSDAGDQPAVESLTFVGVDDADAITAGQQMARGVALARDLVNAPGLDLPPARLAGRAWEMADKHGLECTVYDRAALEEMGAGAIVAVGQGSQREPRLIHLVYRPEGESLGVAGLVGKAITFDTGGVNLKPADGMRNMKMDMAGGAAVIGAMQAIAELKPPFTVHGVVAAAENMPSHTSYRPGDVLRTLSGKTVEITNTDAEGRLVLADALTFTARQGAEFMIDLATLTGASVVAVGNGAASLFGSDDGLVQDVLQAAEFSGERMWQMPLWDAYRADLNSDIADIVNSGNRDGGAIKAALFLREFSHDLPWVHLDIAGPAWSTREDGYRIKCGTGYGTHTLVTLLEQRAGRN